MSRIFALLALLTLSLAAQQPTVKEIIDGMTALMNQEYSKATMTQTIQTSSGKTRTLEFEMFSADTGSSVLIKYIKPTSVRGQAFLMLNDANDIWTYFPRTRRVRKLSSSAKNQKVQGSDFSYSDFSSSDTWQKDYKSTLIGETEVRGTSCWKLEATETGSNDSDYPQVILYIRKADYSPLLIEFFNYQDVHEKTLTLENIVTVEEIPTAKKMVMKNLLEGSETIMIIKDITYQWRPPKGFFTERNLQR